LLNSTKGVEFAFPFFSIQANFTVLTPILALLFLYFDRILWMRSMMVSRVTFFYFLMFITLDKREESVLVAFTGGAHC